MACIISGVFYPEVEYDTKIKSHPVYSNKLAYQAWIGMLHRTYYESQTKTRPSYNGVTVSEEWFIYKNFERWYLSQIIESEVDKDLKYPINNRLYSPETCLLIPRNLNGFLIGLFSTGTTLKGSQCYRNRAGTKVWKAQINNQDKKGALHIGWFYTEEDAHLAWKTVKLGRCLELSKEVNNNLRPYVENLYKVIENFNFKGEKNV